MSLRHNVVALTAKGVARVAERSPILLRAVQRTNFPARWRVVSALEPDRMPEEVIGHVGSTRMAIAFRDAVQREAFFGQYERQTLRLLTSLVRPGDVLIDAGANVGVVTLQLARALKGRGCVHAFEPSPVVNHRLKRNCALNPDLAPLIRVHEVALGEKPGDLTFYAPVDPRNGGWGSLARFPDISANPITVRVNTIDAMMQTFGNLQVRVMKMDIEGFEVEALRGGSQTLAAQRIDYLVLEFNGIRLSERGYSWDHLVRPLEASGYQLRRDLLEDDQLRGLLDGTLPSSCVTTNICLARNGS